MTKKIETDPVKLHFTTTKLRVCFAQLTGPFPKGKKEIFAEGRQTYLWDSKDEVNERKLKVKSILTYVSEHHKETNLIVFPEYSAPSVYLDEEYREFSRKLNCVIIGSPDNVRDGEKIYNKTPVYLPGYEKPLWLIKKHLSPWEFGNIDEPENVSSPIFYWEVSEKKYWLSIHTGLDFLYSLSDEAPPKDDPVLMIVPMCSTDIRPFNNFAGTHFMHPYGGRAIILCNCTGGDFAGRSAVFVETNNDEKNIPAFFIKEKKEAFVIGEIDCDKFRVSKKSTTSAKSSIEKMYLYQLEKLQNDYLITEIQQTTDASKVRAVINPNLFEVFGKKIRISFGSIDQYAKLDSQALIDSGFEIYSLLGNNDVMVSHLNSSISSLLAEIRELLPSWHTSAIREGDSSGDSNIPYFEVNKYYKVLGTTVDEDADRAFHTSIPDEIQLLALLKLGKDWESNAVSDKDKEHFLSKKWLLGKTEMVPGEVNVIMTIRLTSPVMDSDSPWGDFNLRILPFLKKSDMVTSIYEGTNQRANINYLLRIKTKVEDLFQFITEIHSIGLKEKVLFRTNTYIIVNKWSALSLEKSLPFSGLAVQDEKFRDTIILSNLKDSEDRERFRKFSASQQSHRVNTLREIQRLLDEPYSNEPYSEKSNSMLDDNRKLMPEIIYGISFEDLNKLKPSHDKFQTAVEGLLMKIIHPSSDDEFNTIKEELGYKGKDKDRLTYFEKIHVSIKIIRNTRLDLLSRFEESCKNLLDETVSARNAFAHGDYKRTSIDAYHKAMQSYAAFLKHWNGSF